jgi:NAD(P)-dependent dehydrogenase (short-subunit alcohol dehydrogenase family)
MNEPPLNDTIVLVTGSGRRVGRMLALACAKAGADVVVHYGHSEAEARRTLEEIESLNRRGWVLSADLAGPRGAEELMEKAGNLGTIHALVNSAAIFEPLMFRETTLEQWERHLTINLTAPFLLSQAFAAQLPAGGAGRIVNILDWRALRPGADHFPYTISKAALAALTRSLAVALAPEITVNGLAFGAILPPADGGAGNELLRQVPSQRWSTPEEVEQALLFLLGGPAYITGEILHLDGGRHLI